MSFFRSDVMVRGGEEEQFFHRSKNFYWQLEKIIEVKIILYIILSQSLNFDFFL